MDKVKVAENMYGYLANPRKRSGLIVIQEIFGVNQHIRNVTSEYGEYGFTALAPQLFDPIEKDVELAYDEAGTAKGRSLTTQLGMGKALNLIQSSVDFLIKNGSNTISVLGFCWGGSLAWLSACRLGGIHKAVAYYGRQIPEFRNEKPKADVILHFGSNDPLIPMKDVDLLKKAQPDVPLFVYDAGHGFNCEERKDFHPASANLARERTLEFLTQKK